jgi:hypothetical protein
MKKISPAPGKQSPREDAGAPRLLIIDPARPSRCEADRQFSDRLARAFCDAGCEVVWILDEDDPLQDRPWAQLRRLLPPAQEPKRGIARLDGWARTTWRNPAARLPAKTAALIAWAAARVLYRVAYAGGLLAWSASRMPSRLARLFWLAHGGKGSAAARRYWRAADPLLRLGARAWGFLRATPGTQDVQASPGATAAGAEDSGEAELAQLMAALGPNDVAVLPSAGLPELEMLLELLPSLGVSSPVPATLHVRFDSSACRSLASSPEKALLLAARLKSGSPLRTIVLHADTAEQSRVLGESLGLKVHPMDIGPAALSRQFATHAALDVSPSLVVDRFGPVVLVISALWGRTGSSVIFDAQARYLLERGFIVARVLVDHHPERGPGRAARLQKLLAQNFDKVRPHFHLVAERNHGFRHLWQCYGNEVFQQRSPVARFGMLLADASIDRPAAAAWCAARAILSVVNHLPHVAFAERLAKAPIVLETHDIFAKLLSVHGIPSFVPREPDGDGLRAADEAEVWRRVAACVNLSPADHVVVAPVARRSALARPYADRAGSPIRPWPDVLACNGLPAGLGTAPPFDIMLWGDWHEGNVASVRWFLEEVLEKHAGLRQASMLLAGRVIEGLPRRLLRRPRLYAVGFVDRLDDFFARSTVLVIPDRPGSTGGSIKALDALARGCCFASTAAGLRGVGLGDTALKPSDDPAALACDIAGLLQSEDARRARSTIARRLYDLNFSKTAYSRTWNAVLNAVLPAGSDARPLRNRPQDAAAPPPRLVAEYPALALPAEPLKGLPA